MRYRMFGATGLRVSEASLGTGTFGTAWGWGSTPDEAAAVFHRYVERGGNFLDCADGYQNGEAETILGGLIAADRHAYVVSTKYTSAVGARELAKTGNNRKAMMSSIEGSLQRLGTDHVDVFWVHMPDLLTPTEEIRRGLEDVVRQGKARYVGMSDFPAWRVSRAVTMAEARGGEGPAAIQVELNLAERGAERELLPMAQACGLAILVWSPLGGGTLSGKYRDKAAKGRVNQGGGPVRQIPEARREAILGALDTVAGETGATPAQIAIAWVRSREPVGASLIPVLGARTVEQLDDNLGAFALALDAEQLARLDDASAIEPGFPHELLANPQMRDLHSGGHWNEIVPPMVPRP